jgi:carboxyl-terminal processing protease
MPRIRTAASLLIVAIAAFWLGGILEFHYGGYVPSWVNTVLLYHPPQHDLDYALLHDEIAAIEEHYINPNLNGTTLTQGAAGGILTSLGQQNNDKFSRYETPTEYRQSQEFLQGSFAGIGASIMQQGSQIEISSVLPDTPAEHAGIKAGDVIVSVNGQSVAGSTEDQVVSKIRGPAGTHVIVEVQRGGHSLRFDIVRQNITVPSVGSRVFDGRVLYVRIFDFGDRTSSEFDNALRDNLKGPVDRVVLDLRDNPGGFVDAAVSVISEFVQRGTAVVIVQRGGHEEVDGVTGDGRAYSPRLVILVNGNTASAAEITAGALRDYQRGTLVGAKTFGKGSVQEDFLLRDGSDLHLTIAHWLTPKRHPIDGVGITPDDPVALPDSSNQYAVDQPNSDPSKDAQLQAALTLALQ